MKTLSNVLLKIARLLKGIQLGLVGSRNRLKTPDNLLEIKSFVKCNRTGSFRNNTSEVRLRSEQNSPAVNNERFQARFLN
jgi:hypothetical protein